MWTWLILFHARSARIKIASTGLGNTYVPAQVTFNAMHAGSNGSTRRHENEPDRNPAHPLCVLPHTVTDFSYNLCLDTSKRHSRRSGFDCANQLSCARCTLVVRQGSQVTISEIMVGLSGHDGTFAHRTISNSRISASLLAPVMLIAFSSAIASASPCLRVMPPAVTEPSAT